MIIRAIFDILIVTSIIYLALIFIRQTRSYFMLTALVSLVLINLVAKTLDLGLTEKIFQPLVTFFLIIFVVVFQREIRRFLEWFTVKGRNLARERTRLLSRNAANMIVEAVMVLASGKRGAIIVFPRDYPLDSLLEGGFALDGRISSALLLSIFDPSSPGHDGAVIIDDNRIKRFGVHLPLAEHFADFARVGTRHRAAAGVTEKSDALALVVSEERGTISKSESGVLTSLDNREAVELVVHQFFADELADTQTTSPWQYLVVNNLSIKLISLAIAILLWFSLIYR
ncbi:MAG: DNA integrity scanning protein DisA nucleotide-binding domain protein [Candidatus Vogelbacteria bacterium]|nr:DNA integrity scanning protein DisA nucleotide-binding domain protein [Candidatus Vogelbacteria bacterium]